MLSFESVLNSNQMLPILNAVMDLSINMDEK